MKKGLVLYILGFLFLPVIVFAFADLPIGTGPTITSLFANILNAVWIIFTAIAVIMFVFSAILFLTAQGDPSKLATAKQAFLWGAAGVVVGIIAFSIVQIIEKELF